MAKYKPPLVLIAPKGENYSSIDDESFTSYQSLTGRFIELTIEEYAAWAITTDSISCRSEQIQIPLSGEDPDPDSNWEVLATGRRYSFDGGGEQTVIDFPGMAFGSMNASRPFESKFRISAKDQSIGDFRDKAEKFRFNDDLVFGIKVFYHRDKFYLVWDVRPSSMVGLTFDVKPTKLSFTQTVTFSDTTKTITYELNV